MILVTHDLGVVADIADRVVVMYAGRVVEQGTLEEIFYDPQHPYTWGLLGSITRVDRDRGQRLPAIPGLPPSLLRPPTGCHFRPRCPHSFDELHRGSGADRKAPRRSRSPRSLLAGARGQAHAAPGRRPDRTCQPGEGGDVSAEGAAGRDRERREPDAAGELGGDAGANGGGSACSMSTTSRSCSRSRPA